MFYYHVSADNLNLKTKLTPFSNNRATLTHVADVAPRIFKRHLWKEFVMLQIRFTKVAANLTNV